MIVNVIIDLKNSNVNQTYSYLVPKELKEDIFIGQRVFVEFGKQERMALIIEITKDFEVDFDLKEIKAIIDLEPLLDAEMLLITNKLLEYPLVFRPKVFEIMIPAILRPNYQRKVILIDKQQVPRELLAKFNSKDEWILKKQDSKFNKTLLELKQKNIIILETNLVFKAQDKYQIFYTLNDTTSLKLTPKQAIIINSINKDISKDEALEIVSKSVIDTLIKKDILTITKKIKRTVIDHKFAFTKKEIILSKLQQNAYENLSKNFEVNLLFGVNSSGKTEVYLKWIADCIKKGKKALIIVPNTILLPSLTQRIKATFDNDLIAIINPNYKNSNRFDEIVQVYDQSKKIIIGTKEAIFLKLDNLGLLIIDEEQAQEYIEISNPSYDVREIAKIRAKHNDIPLVLVSATPSLKTYYKAIKKEYKFLELPLKAVNQKTNLITQVNMKEAIAKEQFNLLSELTTIKISETLKKDEQVLVLINKKGYARIVMCETCGYIPKCPDCNKSLIFYFDEFKLKCNNCNYSKRYSKTCPDCGTQNMHQLGLAIDAVKKELEKTFLQNVIKIDSETISKSKQGFEKIYNEIVLNQTKIILGTQLISKGVNFDNVALVVILKIEDLLELPLPNADFLTYCLLVQTINRTGRVKQGEVVIQAYDFSNKLFDYALNNDYKGFFNSILLKNELLKIEPFYETNQINVSHPSLLKASQKINQIKDYLNEQQIYTIGPTSTKTLNLDRLNEQVLILKVKNKLDYKKLNEYLESLKDKQTKISFFEFVK